MQTDAQDTGPGAGSSGVPRVNTHYLAAVGVVLAFIWLVLPSYSWHAEVYYETGTNYFSTAYHDDLGTNLWKTDAGYLPWLQRLVAVFTVKVCGCVRYFPQVAALIANLIDAALVALICLRPYRRLVPNDTARFLIAAGLGCGLVMTPGAYILFNIPYFGIVLLLTVPFIDLDGLSRWAYRAHLLLVPLLVLSKALLIAFAPVYGLALAAGVVRRRRREVVLSAVTIAACLAQAYTLYESRKTGVEHDAIEYKGKEVLYPLENPGGYLKDLGFFYQESYPFAYLKPAALPGSGQMAVLLAVAYGCLLADPVRRRDWRLVGLTAAGPLVSLGNATLNIVAHPKGQIVTWLQHPAAVSNVSLCFVTLVLIASWVRDRPVVVPLLAVILLALAVRRPEPMYDHGRHHHEQHSQWKTYCHLVETPDYVIPVNDSPWVMKRNCEWLNWAQPLPIPGATGVDLVGPLPWSREWVIRAVMFETNPDQRTVPAATRLRAYDESGREVGTACRLSKPNYRFQYYWFPEPTRVARVGFTDEAGNPIPVHGYGLRLYGRRVVNP